MAGLQGDRSDHGVGGDRLRGGRAAADAGRRTGAQERPVNGDGGGRHAGRAGRRGRGRLRAGVQGRCPLGRNVDRRRGRRGGAPGGDRGGGSTRFRTGLEGSRDYTLAGRLSLRPSVEVGLRHDGGDAENGAGMDVGYGLAVGSRFVGTPRFGVGTSEYGRDYRLGYSLGALGGEGTKFELGVDAQRRESSLQGGTDHGALARATMRW